MKTNVGIIGTGGIANSHANGVKAAEDIAELTAVADINEAKAKEFAQGHNAPKVYTDYQDMLKDDEIEMVCICTPSFTHAQISIDALQAGKAVLCEKPVGGSLQEIDQISRTVKEYNGTFNSIFQWRYGRGLALFKELQKQGITGPVLWAQSDTLWMRKEDYYNVDWRGTWDGEKGGALLTLAIHAIDALVSILDKPKHVYADVDTLNHDIETDDSSSSVIRMHDSSIANINVTSCNHTNTSHVNIICRDVTVESNTQPYSTSSWPWFFKSSDDAVQERIDEIVQGVDPGEEGKLHFKQMRDFITCFQAGKEPPVTAEEARRSLEIITGIYKSGLTGEVVDFPIPEEDPFYSSLHGTLTEWRR